MAIESRYHKGLYIMHLGETDSGLFTVGIKAGFEVLDMYQCETEKKADDLAVLYIDELSPGLLQIYQEQMKEDS